MGRIDESLIRRMGELRVVSDLSVRRAYQRLREMAEFRRDEPIATYRGRCPRCSEKRWGSRSNMGSAVASLHPSCAGQPSI